MIMFHTLIRPGMMNTQNESIKPRPRTTRNVGISPPPKYIVTMHISM